MKRLALALWLSLLAPVAASADLSDFPRPPELASAVEFWVTIYSEVPTSAGLLHDPDNLSIVYERLDFGGDIGRTQRSQRVRERKAHYREQLRAIARGDRDALTSEQRRILEQFPRGVSDQRLRQAARTIRFQLGQSDKFRAGLVRSGAWEPHIRRTLTEMGLPQELAALPHVESSFNPDAWSAAGAAGIWQFTRATGQRYMRVDRIVDERLDPFRSSVAAARLLDHNHSVTGSWALALTAYNHGLAGVRRAVETVGTKDFGEIVEHYDGRNWGFASRNFYAAFLAAVEVDFNAEQHFADLERRDPIASDTVEIPFFASASDLARAFEVDLERLRKLNRALREPVWQGDKRVPRGYALRVPVGPDRPPVDDLIARVDTSDRYYAQIPDRYHTVRWGESLSTIARRYDVSMQRLVSLNELTSANTIRAGQELRLPLAGSYQGHDPSDPVYVVQAGDTLSGIADRVGMTSRQLARRNGIEDRHSISPGQKLRVDSRPASRDESTQRASADTGSSTSPPEQTTAQTDGTEPGVNSEAGKLAAREGEGEPPAATTNPFPVASAGAQAEQNVDAREAQRLALVGGGHADESSQPAPSEEPSTFTEEDDQVDSGPPNPTELAADPADYDVAADGTIEIQAAETLGHYAEWLDMRASELRRLNDMRYGDPLVIGRRLQLEFSRIPPERFEQRRRAYHEKLQGRFFEQFQIAGTERQLVNKGDSLWSLAQRSDNVPVWLLRQYNPDLDFSELKPGMPVTLPRVRRQAQGNEAAGTQQAEAEGDGTGT